MGSLVSVVEPGKSSLTEADIEELKKLFFNKGDWFSKEVLASAKYDHPLNLRDAPSGATYEKTADFAFQCRICADIGLEYQWYRVILGTIGGSPLLQQGTRSKDLWRGYNGHNLKRITPDDKKEYFSSGLNFVQDVGYVCDHCQVSCIDDNK